MPQDSFPTDTEAMAPVFISSRNNRIVVFGGGKVALRKCLHFKGFRMTVVAESILPEIKEIATKTIERRFDADEASGYMEDVDMVIVATDDAVMNASIRDTAMSLGIPTNSAHGGGDILIPSTLRRRGYTVTVSTEGKASAFPPYVIRQIDGFLTEDYDIMLDIVIVLRTEIRDRIGTQQGRAAFLATVLDDENIWNLIRTEGADAAYEHARKMIR